MEFKSTLNQPVLSTNVYKVETFLRRFYAGQFQRKTARSPDRFNIRASFILS